MQTINAQSIKLLRLKSNPISLRLAIAAGLVVIFVAVPLAYIFIRAWGAETEAWQRLFQARIWKLMGNTLLLAGTVTAGALITGVSMAWYRAHQPGG